MPISPGHAIQGAGFGRAFLQDGWNRRPHEHGKKCESVAAGVSGARSRGIDSRGKRSRFHLPEPESAWENRNEDNK